MNHEVQPAEPDVSDPNPYESPKEASPRPTIKAGVGIGMLLLMSIPAGCICGGVTCFSAGIAADSLSRGSGAYYDGWLFGIPIGLAIVVLIPVLTVVLFGTRKPAP